MEFITAEQARALMPVIPEHLIKRFNEAVREAATKNSTNTEFSLKGVPFIIREMIWKEWIKGGITYALLYTDMYSISWRKS